jgi:hypothetical protein
MSRRLQWSLLYLLQDRLHLMLQCAVLGVVLPEVWLQNPNILRERNAPNNLREMITLGRFLVPASETLQQTQS